VPNGPAQNTFNTVRVTFSAAVNPATFTPTSVTLTGPNGVVIKAASVTAVAGSGNKQFDINFATQTVSGNYTFVLATTIHDPAGHAIVPYKATFVISPVITASSTAQVPVPGGSKAASTVTVNQSMTIGGVEVLLNITDNYDGGLYIHLTAPNGTDILLSNRNGGTGKNFTSTLFTDGAPGSIRTGSAPFTGSFQAEVPLSFLNGNNAQGAWKLWVEDRGGGSDAIIRSWSLTIIAAPGTVLTQSINLGSFPDSGVVIFVSSAGGVVSPVPTATGVAAAAFTAGGVASPVSTPAIPGLPPADVWRSLAGSESHGSDVSGNTSPGDGPMSDRVFSAPGSASAIRETAWLSRLSGGHDEDDPTEDALEDAEDAV
jgi:subtilisin-like proprotein convertase family protein